MLELGSNGAIKQAARAGLGISLLSRAAVEAELAGGQLGEIPLRDAPRSRPWYVLRSVGRPLAAGGAGAPRAPALELRRGERRGRGLIGVGAGAAGPERHRRSRGHELVEDEQLSDRQRL